LREGPTSPEEPKVEARWAEVGRGFWGRAANPSPSARRLGERCKLPYGVRSGAPEAERVSCNFSMQSGWLFGTL